MTKVYGAIALAAGLLDAGTAVASLVKTVDTYEMLGGPFTGEVLTLEVRYPVPPPDLQYLQIGPTPFCEGFSMSVSFLDVSSSACEDGLLVNVRPQYYNSLEIYGQFLFDPALNANGLIGISMNPSGGFFVIDQPQGPDNVDLFDFIFDFGSFYDEYRIFDDEAQVPTISTRETTVIPLPMSILFLSAALAALLGLRGTGPRTRLTGPTQHPREAEA